MIKIIHQVNKTHVLNDFQLKSKESIIQFNPDMEYKLWSDDDIYELVKDKYSQISNIWSKLKGIQKADLGRYAIIHSEGGFYVDTDIFALKQFIVLNENILNICRSIPDYPWSNKDQVTNYFFYSPKENEILLLLINESCKRVLEGGSVPYTTGKVVLNYILKNKNFIIYPDDLVFNKFCPNVDIPEKAILYHDGGTSRECKGGWNGDTINNIIKTECELRELLGVEKRSIQMPYLFIILIILFILFSILIIYIFFIK